MITLNNIAKRYPATGDAEVTALHDVSLDIARGEVFGIIGKSGAGKSTLLRCINLLETPSSGHVIVDDVELTALSASALREQRRNIGMIFQHFNLLMNKTVAENIALPLRLIGTKPSSIRQRINELLTLVDLENKAKAYPAQLSGGQKQRVAIARALATNPHILLCDEATSALDPQTTQVILQLLDDLHKQLDLTIVLITHELDVVKDICDRVAVLDQGRLVECASALELFTQPQAKASKDIVASRRLMPAAISERLVDADDSDAQPLLLLTFLGFASAQPILAQLIRQFNLDLSIIQADIEMIHGESVGTLLIECPISPAQQQQLIDYCKTYKVQVEVLGHVRHAD